MFVRQSTYREALAAAVFWKDRYEAQLNSWNALVRQINDKGGEAFLKRATISASPSLSLDEIRKLLQPCHPDKHDGKPMACEMTARLLAIKDSTSP